VPGRAACIDVGVGISPVDAFEHVKQGGDVSLGLGITNLGGGVAEMMLDSRADATSICWAASSLTSPACLFRGIASRSTRGGSWGDTVYFIRPGMRPTGILVLAVTCAHIGLRCARAVAVP
jgi:hypothetical protein